MNNPLLDRLRYHVSGAIERGELQGITEQKPDYVFMGPKYKTLAGASKRAAFETGIQPGEVARGERSKAYRWFSVQTGADEYRVARFKK